MRASMFAAAQAVAAENEKEEARTEAKTEASIQRLQSMFRARSRRRSSSVRTTQSSYSLEGLEDEEVGGSGSEGDGANPYIKPSVTITTPDSPPRRVSVGFSFDDGTVVRSTSRDEDGTSNSNGASHTENASHTGAASEVVASLSAVCASPNCERQDAKDKGTSSTSGGEEGDQHSRKSDFDEEDATEETPPLKRVESSNSFKSDSSSTSLTPTEFIPSFDDIHPEEDEEGITSKIVLPTVQVGKWKQIRWLVWRECLNLVRDRGAILYRFGTTIFLNILFGLVFLNVARQNNADPIFFNNHYGALVLVTIRTMFSSASAALIMFPAERPYFIREYSTGTYQIFPYMISKMCIELPLGFLQACVQSLCVYFLMGLKGNFFFMALSWWALALTTNSIAIAIGASIKNIKQAAEATPLIFVPQLMFCGFFIATADIPGFLRWAQWIVTLKYILNLVLINEFSQGYCESNPGLQLNCDDLFARNNFNYGMAWFYSLILIILFVVTRLIGAVCLVSKAKQVYS